MTSTAPARASAPAREVVYRERYRALLADLDGLERQWQEEAVAWRSAVNPPDAEDQEICELEEEVMLGCVDRLTLILTPYRDLEREESGNPDHHVEDPA
jgi:hypothetical protein